MRWNLVLSTLSLVLFYGCPSTNSKEIAPPSPVLSLAKSTAWTVVRRGTAPTIRQGSLHVSISGVGAREDQRYLPGIAFGRTKGPALGFLSGFFAPLIVPAEPSRDYDARILGGDPELRVQLGDLVVRTGTVGRGHVRSVVVGEALVALPADRTELRASFHGQPTARFKVSAGDEPSTVWIEADRLEVVTGKLGTVAIVTDCPSIGVVRPTPKGTTSVFLLHVGARAPVNDALFTSEAHAVKPGLACPQTSSSTVSLPWP